MSIGRGLVCVQGMTDGLPGRMIRVGSEQHFVTDQPHHHGPPASAPQRPYSPCASSMPRCGTLVHPPEHQAALLTHRFLEEHVFAAEYASPSYLMDHRQMIAGASCL